MFKEDGFTLIELMITITIAAVLLAIAAPSFYSLMVSQRIKTTSFDVIASLSFARSEALKSNAPITVVPVGGNWAAGWQVKAPDGSVVQTQGATTNVSITGPASLTFNRSGRVVLGSGVFQLNASTSGLGYAQRCITLDPTGIPRSKMGGCS